MNEENKVVETTEEVKTVETPKKSKKGLVVNLILIIIALLGVLGYFAYDKLIAHKSNTKDKAKTEETNKKEEKKKKEEEKKKEEAKEQEETKKKEEEISKTTTIKIDDSKGFVYDAEYDRGSAPSEYGLGDKTYYLSDLVVPYININTDAARLANDNIKSVFDEVLARYNEGASGKSSYVKFCEYKYYINNNILSVVFKTGLGGTGVVHPYYHTYNFDLNTGNRLTINDAYAIKGFDAEGIRAKVQEQMEIQLRTKKDYPETGEWSYESSLARAMGEYDSTVANNTTEFYFDNLNYIVIQVVVPIGDAPGTNRKLLLLL